MDFSGNKDRNKAGRFDRSREDEGRRRYAEEDYYGTAEGSLEDEEDYREYVREREMQAMRQEAGRDAGNRGQAAGTSSRKQGLNILAGPGKRVRSGQAGRAEDGWNSAEEGVRSFRDGRQSEAGAGRSFREEGQYAAGTGRSFREEEQYAAGAGRSFREEGQSEAGAGRGFREEEQSEAGAGRDFRGGNRPAQGETGGHDEGNQEKGSGRKRRKRGIFARLLVILFLIFVIGVFSIGGFLFFKMRSILNVKRINSVKLEERLLPNIASKVKNDEMMAGYTNIALFGVDSRSGDLLEGDNRSDSIMICSINDKTGEIRLVSLYRDTLLNVGDDVYTKANAAYARGGPEAAINMLNRNLDMNILDFVTVGFQGLANTIDALGGIELEIDEEERGYINMYLHDMHAELGTPNDKVESSGLVKLNGIQATAYSRIRYTAGDDFRRAERQRTVLKLTLEKAKAASPVKLADVVNNVAGDLAMSLSSGEIVGLILKAGKLELVGTEGLPREEYRGFGSTYEDGEFILPLSLGDNVCWLHEFLFKEDDYRLSEEAEAINNYIGNNFWAN